MCLIQFANVELLIRTEEKPQFFVNGTLHDFHHPVNFAGFSAKARAKSGSSLKTLAVAGFLGGGYVGFGYLAFLEESGYRHSRPNGQVVTAGRTAVFLSA